MVGSSKSGKSWHKWSSEEKIEGGIILTAWRSGIDQKSEVEKLTLKGKKVG